MVPGLPFLGCLILLGRADPRQQCNNRSKVQRLSNEGELPIEQSLTHENKKQITEAQGPLRLGWVASCQTNQLL